MATLRRGHGTRLPDVGAPVADFLVGPANLAELPGALGTGVGRIVWVLFSTKVAQLASVFLGHDDMKWAQEQIHDRHGCATCVDSFDRIVC